MLPRPTSLLTATLAGAPPHPHTCPHCRAPRRVPAGLAAPAAAAPDGFSVDGVFGGGGGIGQAMQLVFFPGEHARALLVEKAGTLWVVDPTSRRFDRQRYLSLPEVLDHDEVGAVSVLFDDEWCAPALRPGASAPTERGGAGRWGRGLCTCTGGGSRGRRAAGRRGCRSAGSCTRRAAGGWRRGRCCRARGCCGWTRTGSRPLRWCAGFTRSSMR